MVKISARLVFLIMKLKRVAYYNFEILRKSVKSTIYVRFLTRK